MGTRWAATVISCLFSSQVRVVQDWKHDQCHVHNVETFNATRLLVPQCQQGCVHAVVARHPLSLKGGTQQAQWEAYYGGWMRHSDKNVMFLRFETLLHEGCTQPSANPDVVRRSDLLLLGHHTPLNKSVWEFWNYSFHSD